MGQEGQTSYDAARHETQTFSATGSITGGRLTVTIKRDSDGKEMTGVTYRATLAFLPKKYLDFLDGK